MNAAKMTLVSTVVAAALGLALGLMSTPAQAHCGGKHTGDHPHCADGGLITYTAELTGGAFKFSCIPAADCSLGIVEVAPNSRENVLLSNVTLELVRPGDDMTLQDTWDAVFAGCPVLLGTETVDGFDVGPANWRISKSGGVRVMFSDIMLVGLDDGPVEVTVQLVGDTFDSEFDNDPFLPDPGFPSTFDLDVGYIIWGETAKGTHPRMSCQVQGISRAGIVPLDNLGQLVITATAP